MRDDHREKIAVLQREVGIGLADAAAGRFSKKSVSEIAAEVRREQQLKDLDDLCGR